MGLKRQHETGMTAVVRKNGRKKAGTLAADIGTATRIRSKDTFSRLVLHVDEEAGTFGNVPGEESATVTSAVHNKEPAPFMIGLLMT
jgi:hypothetical protein